MKNWIFFLIVFFTGWAFVIPEEEGFVTKVKNHLLTWVQRFPQEKVYLHTDRDHYEAGDTIWFRAHLSNAYTNQPSDVSRFVYVELRDRQDSLYTRIKIPFRDSIFAGHLPLPKKLKQGDYFLRSYSYWMQNIGDEYLFRKRIKLLNPDFARVQQTITWEMEDERYVANIRFHNSRDESYDKVAIDLVQDGKLRVLRTTEQGTIQVKLDSSNFGKKVLVRFRAEDPFEYEQYIYLPDPRKEFVLTYMPEGGNLLAGSRQRIAMKVIGMDGLSREVVGSIYNEQGNEIAYVRTVHKGMGAFEIDVEPGQRYYGIFSMEGGEKKRFDLPEVVNSGVGLKLISNRDIVGFVVNATQDFPQSTPLYLLVHCRGVPVYTMPIRRDSKGKFLVKNLPEGILNFLIMDDQYNVYSERLCFVYPHKRAEISLTTDKQNYHARDLVQVELQVNVDENMPQIGSFSVAVTDDEQVEKDSLQDNLTSYLLLSSDLKGYIEDPAFYFRNERIMTSRYMDLLMMTQGWRRFRVERILRNQYEPLPYFMERGQTISGKVKNFWRKDPSESSLILFSNIGLVRMTTADSSGNFLFSSISFPDSTTFFLQGRTKRGKESLEVTVEKDSFLLPSVKLPFNPNVSMMEDNFYKRFSKDYYYENGEKVYILDETIVKNKPPKKTYSFYDNIADYSLDSAKLAELRERPIRLILQELPGVLVFGDSITRFGKNLLLIVNEFEETLDQLEMIRTEDILVINYLHPRFAYTFFGEKGSNGAITITTSPNFRYKERPRLNKTYFTMLGYQKEAEFYMPRYDVKTVREALAYTNDDRATIYWNPIVRTNSAGKANFSFYTSDKEGPYTMIIEGVLSDGTICRKEKKIYLKKQ